jgi:hypothetical protein
MLRIASGAALGLLGFVLVAELLFRFLPVGTATMTGYHADSAILNYPPYHTWRIATGWDLRNAQTLRSNNLGFASDRNFVPDPRAVALVGDSYVEASMLPADKRPGPQLEAHLGSARPVYALGGPGSSLLDYAERIRYAHQTLAVRDFVVLMEPGDVRQALCGSGNVHSACLDRTTLAPRTQTQATASSLKRALRHSALAQYLASQIRVDAGRLLREGFVRSVPEHTEKRPAQPAAPSALAPEAVRRIDAVSSAFFERVAPHVRGGRLVIVVDGRRAGSRQLEPELVLERARFIAHARSAGATVVDAEPSFAEHARRSNLSLSVGPNDGHLNALGVSIAMAEAAKALE